MNSGADLIPTRRSLLTRLKNWDDQEGWKQFFDTYWKVIYAAAIKSGLTDAEAQDVVQDTIIEVAKKMGSFKYDPARGSFKGWLLKLTRWRVADQFRKRRGPSQHAGPSSDDTARTPTVEGIPDPGPLALDALWDEEWNKNLWDAAIERVKGKVAAKQYQLFDFYAIKEWSVEDIVNTLGVTEHQVYKAKSRIAPLIKKEVEYLESKML